jgi:hypothetical protein
MIDKTSQAGWVVQASIPAEPEARDPDAKWRPSAMLVSAPSFQYFNVAIVAPDKAIEATTKYLADSAKSGELSVVRKLSSAEIAALRLKAGEVKPA